MANTGAKKKSSAFALLQRFGRSLMLPIASLPAAALLLRIGQPDMLGADGLGSYLPFLVPVASVLGAAGGALFENLPMLFALGVAVGFARKSDGSTGLAAVIGYLVMTNVFKALAPYFGAGDAGAEKINYGVLAGIVIGLVAAKLYEKFYRVKLPTYLAFFGGRRFVPIITAASAVLVATVMAAFYPIFNKIVNVWIGGFIVDHGTNPITGFVFGTINRLLIPFGLHHLLNSLPWFQLGECANAAGEPLKGDLTCFLSGTPETAAWTGGFMTGFFPIMMFAIPAIALAFWRTALPARHKAIFGVMFSLALTSFLTGVTEPVEFAFAYVAFPLYAVHAVLTGSALALTNALGIKHGFGFSAGAFDYLLNFTKASTLSGGAGQVLLLLGIGLVYGAIYYFIFTWAINKFNLPTPGREEEGADTDTTAAI